MTRDRFEVVVHVLLLRGPEQALDVFLLRRAGTGFMDGRFVLPGGHLRTGETLAQAAARECLEETGVTPGSLTPCCLLPYRAGAHPGINMVFEGGGLSGEPRLGEPARSDRASWFAVDRLPESTAHWIADVLELRRRGEWFRELPGA